MTLLLKNHRICRHNYGKNSPEARYYLPQSPVLLPPRPRIIPWEPGTSSLTARYPKPFLSELEGRGNEAIEPAPKARYPVRINASWNSRSLVEILAGENGIWRLGQMQTAGYPFPDHLQTSKYATNVAL